MKDPSFQPKSDEIGLSAVVDLFDQPQLFEELNNDAVLTLSRLGGEPGFRDTRSIVKSTGIRLRRLLNPGVQPIDLAMRLCQRLQDSNGVAPGEYHQILLCHSHTDPTAADRLASEVSLRLGLASDAVTGFNFGCSGYLKLLTEGFVALENQSPQTRVALLTVETPEFWHDGSDRLFCGIVSAGATASVLEVGHGLRISAVRSDDFRIPEERRPNVDPLFRRDTASVFDFRGDPCHRTVMRMNAEPVFLNGIELMLDNLRTALLSIECEPDQRVVVAPHQPSGKLLRALIAAASTEFPNIEFLNNLELFGNTISSSVPTLVSQLDSVLERNELRPMKNGDHLILLAAGICMTEICDHMSAGHACLRWSNGVLNAAAPQPQSAMGLVSP